MGEITSFLNDLGIPTTYVNGEYRPLLDILQDLGNCWDKLTPNQKDYFWDCIKGE